MKFLQKVLLAIVMAFAPALLLAEHKAIDPAGYDQAAGFADSLNIENYEFVYPDVFYVDMDNSTDELIRLSVPVIFPHWFVLPVSAVESIEYIGVKEYAGTKILMAKIVFKAEFDQFNSILAFFASIVEEEHVEDAPEEVSDIQPLRLGWRPPWTWSRCAKCKLEVTSFIVGTVFVATAGTGPGALAVACALVQAKYGVAAMEALAAIGFNVSVDRMTNAICHAINKC